MFTPITFAILAQVALAAKSPGLLVYDKTGPLSKFTGGGSKVNWRYNGELLAWGDSAGLDFVPTVRNESVLNDVSSARDKWLQDGKITHILSFETPHTDVFGSRLMDEAKAAELHGFWVSAVPEPLFKIGAPSVYLDMMTDGYPWFDQFDKKCTAPCRFDFIPLQYMGDSFQELQYWVESFKKYNKPIWVTRLACIHGDGANCSEQEATDFMEKAIQWFRSTDNIERWVWDGAHPIFATKGDGSAMLKEDGTLTSLGSRYLTL